MAQLPPRVRFSSERWISSLGQGQRGLGWRGAAHRDTASAKDRAGRGAAEQGSQYPQLPAGLEAPTVRTTAVLALPVCQGTDPHNLGQPGRNTVSPGRLTFRTSGEAS